KHVGVSELVVRELRDELFPDQKGEPRFYRRCGVVRKMRIAGIQAARQELARAEASVPPAARARAREEHANALACDGHVRDMLREARRMYASLTGGRRLRPDEAGDPAQVPELETVARAMAGRYPDLLGAHGY